MKQAAERTLVASGLAAIARWLKRADTLIIAYHNVVPDGSEVRGDASLHLPQRRFATQLDALGHAGDVVSLATIDFENRTARPRFVVTFDDAYLGALTSGVEELHRRGMPATVFVAPGILGTTPWWDLLANPKTGSIEEDARDYALAALAGKRDDVLKHFGAFTDVTERADQRPTISSRVELQHALAYDRLTVGSHTWSHVNLSALKQVDVERELVTSANWLREEFPAQYIPWLSYPYGLSDAAVERSARNAGYQAAVCVGGGWLDRRRVLSRFALPRLNVPSGLSDDGFELRLAGLGTR